MRKVVVGADVGRAVNPALVEAQLAGGAVFGIGNAVLESLEYDAEGQLLTGTLLDYALPLMTDVPAIEAFYQEIPAHTNPLGLRGVGECGNPGLGAAIANAVCDALRDLDVQPHRAAGHARRACARPSRPRRARRGADRPRGRGAFG